MRFFVKISPRSSLRTIGENGKFGSFLTKKTAPKNWRRNQTKQQLWRKPTGSRQKYKKNQLQITHGGFYCEIYAIGDVVMVARWKVG